MLRIADLTLRYPAWGVFITAFLGISLGAKSDYGLVPVVVYGIWYAGCFAYAMSNWRYSSGEEGPDHDPDGREPIIVLFPVPQEEDRNPRREAA